MPQFVAPKRTLFFADEAMQSFHTWQFAAQVVLCRQNHRFGRRQNEHFARIRFQQWVKCFGIRSQFFFAHTVKDFSGQFFFGCGNLVELFQLGPRIRQIEFHVRVVLQTKIDPTRIEFRAIVVVGTEHHRIPLSVGDRCEQFWVGLFVKLKNPVLLFPLVACTARHASASVCIQRLLHSSGSTDLWQRAVARHHKTVANAHDAQRTVTWLGE